MCRTCTERRQQTRCTHTPDQRQLSGTWPTIELYAAMDRGYRVVRVEEVWNYTRWAKYDGLDEATGLFTAYINTFLKAKVEASGYPSGVDTEDQRRAYVARYLEREGVLLDPEKIQKNPGLRSLAKLCLNSFWGKFGQRVNMAQLTYCTTPEQMYDLFRDDRIIVHTVTHIGDDMVAVQHTMEDDFAEVLPNTNPVIAAYTTAQARLHLYQFLEKLGDNCLYFDTDSLVYVKNADYTPPTGEFLGDLTDELADYGPGSYIDEFISAGPKNYAYSVYNPVTRARKAVTKVKGIPLNFATASVITMDLMRDHVQQFVRDNTSVETVLSYPRIDRRGAEKQVVTRTENIKYRVVYDKRAVLPNFHMVPYGYLG